MNRLTSLLSVLSELQLASIIYKEAGAGIKVRTKCYRNKKLGETLCD